MKRFIEGEGRSQARLLPEYLDDYIADDNPVRAVDAFVEELDLKALGFEGADPAETGRPSYHPAVLLKIYIYGYLNRVPSSRRLEREAQRNVELMWLTGRLAPDFKTIADFRRENGVGIRNVCRRFVELCRELKLFSAAIVAIDSSKFKAVNSRDRNFTPGKIDKRQQQIEQSIERYLAALETADRTQPAEVEAKTERLREKIQTLREQMRRMEAIREELKHQPDEQLSQTDPDSRSMISQAKGTGLVGYNVQAAVDAKHHLIVTHEVTNVGSDRAQLTKMAIAARDAMDKRRLQVLADRGYFSSPEIKACTEAGVTPLVPKPMTSNARAEGRFNKADFIYLARDNEYQCPAGQREKAVWRRKLKRSEWMKALQKAVPAGCEVGMEACGGSHQWARELQKLGYVVKLIAPQFVKPYVKSNKNDVNDAEAICEAMSRPGMRFVTVKTVEQQDVQAVHRVRSGLMVQRLAKVNQIRGLVAEYGLVAPKEVFHLRQAIPQWLEDAENGLSPRFRRLLAGLWDDLCSLHVRLSELDAEIAAIAAADPVAKRLQQLRGVGPMTATALVATIGDGAQFANGRQMAAALGLTPKQSLAC